MTREPMRCPSDGARLVEIERSEIVVDACPECRGVWLDRGELDKIIDRADGGGDRQYDRGRHFDDDDDWDDRRGGDEYRYGKRRRKRGGFLGEMFEFGD